MERWKHVMVGGRRACKENGSLRSQVWEPAPHYNRDNEKPSI